jgi:hypothetical protein
MGIKRFPPNFLRRLAAGWRAGTAALVASSGVAGTALTAISSTGAHVAVPVLWESSAVCVLVGLGSAYLRGRMRSLPDQLVDEMNADGRYIISCCSSELLREACELTKPYYGHEYVPFDIAEQWRLKNPKAFVQIVNSDRVLCACLGVFGLSRSFMEQFIAGHVEDSQLSGSICKMTEAKTLSQLYISGVVVRDPASFLGHKRARVMIWALLKYLKTIYGLSIERSLFALAVTRESERLLKALGFELISGKSGRVDKCNLYVFTLTKDSWARIMHKTGDCSHMCEWQIR